MASSSWREKLPTHYTPRLTVHSPPVLMDVPVSRAWTFTQSPRLLGATIPGDRAQRREPQRRHAVLGTAVCTRPVWLVCASV
jgi:hypothetical protein